MAPPKAALRQESRHISHAEMLRVLARNSGKSDVPEEKPALAWGPPVWTNEAKTHGFIISQCERYFIDKAGGSYNSWRRGTIRQHAGKWLGNTQDPDAAKRLCEADAR